ncbi:MULTISPECIES: low temperature requirement protein A [unclassified Micromonospora]|uniref:low temperature requirement protein A n=1 Tax=unclassified Micromonospora TaxID=2617518 RepID=UPI0033A6388D
MTTARAKVLRTEGTSQRATFLELFFDLAFVFTLTRLSRELGEHLSWIGAVQTMVLLLAVFSIWSLTAAMCDVFDPMKPSIELLIFATMVGSLVLAAAMADAFGERGLLFAGTYIAIHIGRNLFLIIAIGGQEVHRRDASLTLIWYGISAVPWITGAFAQGTGRLALWAAAVVLEYTATRIGFPVPGLGRMTTSLVVNTSEHLAERYRQLFTVALGELILIAGVAHGAGDFEAHRNAAFAVAFLITVLLWRIYIYRAGEFMDAAAAKARAPVRLARAVSQSHVIMVAGVVVTAVGQDLTIIHPTGHTEPAWVVVILGGPALFLLGRAAFERAVFARVHAGRLISAMLLLVAIAPAVLILAAKAPGMLPLSPLAVASATTAALLGTAISDTVRMHRHPAIVAPTGGQSIATGESMPP